jgi:hypothetical protein
MNAPPTNATIAISQSRGCMDRMNSMTLAPCRPLTGPVYC